jgi:cytochrome c oxidase subunit 2
MKLLDAKGCLACHSVDGSAGVGPTFKGAWGAPLQLADGSTRTFDSATFIEKVHHPDTIAIKDFPPVMPVIPLTDDEIAQIEAYLEGLQK